MTCTDPGCAIWYTTNSMTPTISSLLYTSPVVVKTTHTLLKVISVAMDKSPSEVTTSSIFKIHAAEPEFFANGTAWGGQGPGVEEFVKEASVFLESPIPETKFYYTLNNDVPTLSSKIYDPDQPIII